MKNEDKRKNKGKLKYIGVVVVVVFLAGIYLASATTVITDIQMTIGNVTIREDEIEVGNPTTIRSEDVTVACNNNLRSYVKLDSNVWGGCNGVGILMNEYRNHNKLWLSAYDASYGNLIYTVDPGKGSGQGFGIAGGDGMAPFDRFVVNSDETFLGYSIRPGDGTPASGDGDGNLYVRGNVGIGTTSPGYKLHVIGSTRLENPVGNPGPDALYAFQHSNVGRAGYVAILNAANPAPALTVQTQGTGPILDLIGVGGASARVRVTNEGNVGIGTTSPGSGFNTKFDVVGSSSFRTNSGDTTKALKVDTSGSRHRIYTDATRGTAYDLILGTYPKGHMNQLVLQQSTGNVGIGTTSPTSNLDVAGGAAIATDGQHAIWLGGEPQATTNADVKILSQGYWYSFAVTDASGNDNYFTVKNPTGDVYIKGNLNVDGTKNFVQAHPTDPTKEIVYVSLEGPEAGTYIRGTAQLVNGEAVISLPEHFSLVTSDEGLTVQLTPVGEWLQLYVVEKCTKQVIIREANGKNGQFDYLFQGVRKGYETHQVIRDKE